MNETLANVAIITATISTVVFLIPQIVKLIRTGDSEGVSATWPALGFVSNVGWFVFVINQELWAAIFAPFFTFIFYAVTLWAIARTGRSLRKALLYGAAWTALLAAIPLILGWTELGVVLGLSYGVMLAPSLWTAYRTTDPSGIAPGTWWIGTAEGILWGVYGVFNQTPGIITFGVVAVVGSTAMLIRYYSTREPAVEMGVA